MCRLLGMTSNLALDDLIEEARRTGRHRTKKETVIAALQEYVPRHRQLRLLKIFGTIEYDPAYDYRAARRRRR